eukprot:COSAG01_NODE_23_length_37704_cov_30.005877_25_plen_112_part_00
MTLRFLAFTPVLYFTRRTAAAAEISLRFCSLHISREEQPQRLRFPYVSVYHCIGGSDHDTPMRCAGAVLHRASAVLRRAVLPLPRRAQVWHCIDAPCTHRLRHGDPMHVQK